MSDIKERNGTPKRVPPRRTSTLSAISEDPDTSFDENFDFKGRKRMKSDGKYINAHLDRGTLASAVENQAQLSSEEDVSNNSSIENISLPKKQRRQALVKDKYLKQPLDLNVVSKAIEAGESSMELSSEDEPSIKRVGPRHRPRQNRSVNNKVAPEDFAQAVGAHDVSISTESEKDEKVSRNSSARAAIAETINPDLINNSNNRKRIRLHRRDRISTKISDFAANVEQMGNEMKNEGDSTFESSSSTSTSAIISPRRPLRPSVDERPTTSPKTFGKKISIFEHLTDIEKDKIAKNQDKLLTKTSLRADDSNVEAESTMEVTQQAHDQTLRVVMEKLTQSVVEANTAKEDRNLVTSKSKRSSSTYNDAVHGILDIIEYSSDADSKGSSRDSEALLQNYNSKFPSSSLNVQFSPEKSDPDETKLLPQNKSQHESSIINRSLSIMHDTTPVKWSPNNVSLRQLRRSSTASPRKSINNTRRSISFVTESNDDESSAKKSFGRSKNTSIGNVAKHLDSGLEANKKLFTRNEEEKAPETSSKTRRQSSNSKISPSKSSSRYSTRSQDEKDPEATIINPPSTRRSLSLKSNKRHSTRSVGEKTVDSPVKKIQSPFKQSSPSKSGKRNSIINNKENTPVTPIKKSHSLGGQISPTKSNKRYSTRSEEGKVPEMVIINESRSPDKQLSKSRYSTRSEEAPRTPQRNMKNQSTSGQNYDSRGEEAPTSPNNKTRNADSQNSPSKSRNSTRTKGDESPNSKSQVSNEQISGSRTRSRYSIGNEGKEAPQSSININKTYDAQNSALKSIRRHSTRNDDENDPETPINKTQSTGGLNSVSTSKGWHLFGNEGEEAPKSPINKSKLSDAQHSALKSGSRYSTRSKGDESLISRSQAAGEQVSGSKSRSRYTIENDGGESPKLSVDKNRTPDKQISPSKSRARFSIGLEAPFSTRPATDGQIPGSQSRSRQLIGNEGEEAPNSSVNKNRTSGKQNFFGPNSRLSYSIENEDEETPKLLVRGRSSTRSRKSLEAEIGASQASGGQISASKSNRIFSSETPIKKTQSTDGLNSGSKSKKRSSTRSRKSLEASISKSQTSGGQISASKFNRGYSSENETEEDFETTIKKTQSTDGLNSGSKSKKRSSTRSRKSLEASISKSQASGGQISASKFNRDYSSESDGEESLGTPIKKTQSTGGPNSGSKSKKRSSTRGKDETSVKTLNLSQIPKNKTLGNISTDVNATVNKGSFDARSSTVRSKGKMNTSLNFGTNKLLENISPIKKFHTLLHAFPGSPADSSQLSPAYENTLVEKVNSAASIRTSSPQKKTSNVSNKRSSSNSLTREPKAKKPRLVQSTIQFQSPGKSLRVSKKLSISQNKSKVNTTVNKSLTTKKTKKVVTTKKPAKKKDIGFVIPKQYVKYNAERFTLKRLSSETVNAIHKASENFLKDTVKHLENQMRIEGRTDFTHKDLLKYLITIGLYKDKSDWIEWVRKYAPLDIREVLIPCARAGNVVF